VDIARLSRFGDLYLWGKGHFTCSEKLGHLIILLDDFGSSFSRLFLKTKVKRIGIFLSYYYKKEGQLQKKS